MNKIHTHILTITLIATIGTTAHSTPPFTDAQYEALDVAIDNFFDKYPEKIEEYIKKAFERKRNSQLNEAKGKIEKYRSGLFENSKDPIGGNKKGSISMVVFMDPYCGYCRKFAKVLDSVTEDVSELKIIYKPVGFLGEQSKQTATEELAAHAQGKFKNYHQALYESAASDRKSRMTVAEDNGIDVKRFKKDIEDYDIVRQAKYNHTLAKNLGVDGTPAFIIGNQMVMGYVDADELKKIIKQAK